MTKALLGTGAAAAALVSTASPALARDRHDGIDVGDVIAGAVVLGGIAAVAGAIGNDRDRGYSYGYPTGGYNDSYRYDDRYGYNNRYDRYGYRNGNPRQAIEQCVATAENQASRYSYGRADVTDIRAVDRNSRGYTVRGRIAVNSQNRGWRRGDSYYGNGWNNDYRGWNDNLRGYDAGSFKCRVEYGRVVDLDFDGIRGLR
ncbi:hypothetical protein [Novosphingobium sp. Gsoil 351]|uniref:hypothetical protein n=1 Tax=Novosphingobium sp. Gsoil 351 TaxID=2675225 RepID=UPI00351B1E35